MKPSIYLFLAFIPLVVAGCCSTTVSHNGVRLKAEDIINREGIVLTPGDRLTTPGVFRPPVDIMIVAKTDSTNLRIAYAADQVIFNWELNPQELRINGGPADRQHKPGFGSIPTGKFVSIRWLVTPKRQSIFVDGELRFEHDGDYAHISQPVSVFPAIDSTVTVKLVKVRELPEDSK